jgi:iron complex transport system substrate-binding protein
MKKKFSILALIGALLLSAVGCSSNTQKTDTTYSAKTSISTSAKKTENQTRTFVDSVGRKVEVPEKITKIAPSGSLAQLVLYTSSPDLLVGLSGPFSKDAQEFIDKKYQELPQFGQFYGKSANLNMEALSAAEPDVVIDIGETKDNIKEDMDKLQNQMNIPTIFIEANLENMAETYEKLGDLLGNAEETEKLGQYCEKVLKQANDVHSSLTEAEQKRVYYAAGTAGLNTNAEGSFHAQVMEVVGAKNAATGVDVVSKSSGTTVPMEQLLQWQPDYILAESPAVYDIIMKDKSWQELKAVKEGKVYQVPTAPYNFLGAPPSVNRIIGIQWLGQLIYPDHYKLNIEDEVKEFYQLFYHAEPTAEQLKAILKNAG